MTLINQDNSVLGLSKSNKMLEVVNTGAGLAGGSSPSRIPYMTDDEALKILSHANTPQNDRWSPMDQKIPMSPVPSRYGGMTMSRATTARTTMTRRRLKTAPSQQKIEDEEALKTKRFWENWAAEATKNLLSDLNESDDERREPVFSGRCGTEPKFQLQRSQSSESVHTDLSLMACSDLIPDRRKSTLKTKKKKNIKKAPDGPNWEMFAKAKKGMLDRFIQADASRMDGYMKSRAGPIQNVLQKSRATDIMTKHERKMLTRCAYSRGLMLANDSKSYSTENIVFVPKNKPTSDMDSEYDGGTTEEDSRGLCSDKDEITDTINPYAPTGRTPSPQAVVSEMKVRPDSAIAALNPLDDEKNVSTSRCSSASMDSLQFVRPCISRGNINDESRASSVMAPTTIYRRHSNILGLPDIDGVFSTKVRRRIHTTLKNLSKATGFGDRTDTCTVIEEEQGLYTEADYARHPRFPQNIKIAPSLSRVIREDIRERMGRPRRHEIKTSDLQAYDCDQPQIGRAHRNLLIFNWLNEITETGFIYMDVPEIKDLEGAPPNRTYCEFIPGIVGENEEGSEGSCYRGSPMTAPSRYGGMTNYTASRYGGATNYEPSRYGGATNYEPSRFGGTTFYEGSEDNESDFTSDDSFYN